MVLVFCFDQFSRSFRVVTEHNVVSRRIRSLTSSDNTKRVPGRVKKFRQGHLETLARGINCKLHFFNGLEGPWVFSLISDTEWHLKRFARCYAIPRYYKKKVPVLLHIFVAAALLKRFLQRLNNTVEAKESLSKFQEFRQFMSFNWNRNMMLCG